MSEENTEIPVTEPAVEAEVVAEETVPTEAPAEETTA